MVGYYVLHEHIVAITQKGLEPVMTVSLCGVNVVFVPTDHTLSNVPQYIITSTRKSPRVVRLRTEYEVELTRQRPGVR